MTNNFIEYPNPSLGYPKLITQTILANTAVTDSLKATIFIIIFLFCLQSHTSYSSIIRSVCSICGGGSCHSVCVLAWKTAVVHTVQKLIRIWRAEIHTIQISFVVLSWVVLKHETAPLLDAGATKWAAHALHLCGSKHFCQSLFALHTSNTYICICNTRCSVFAVLSILVYVQCAGFICSSHVSHLHLLSGGCSAFRVVDISANTPQSTIFSGGMRLLTGVKDCWENVESWQEETLRGWEFSILGTCTFSIWLHSTQFKMRFSAISWLRKSPLSI